jgi:serine/threonine protein kinase
MKTIAKSNVSTIVETEEGKILKIINKRHFSAYPCYLFCAAFCSHKNILQPEVVEIKEDKLHVLMGKAEPLTQNSSVDPKKLLVDVLDALCYFETFNLIHGDIKPQNIVLRNNSYCLIDFDILITRGNNISLSQSCNDVYGYALRTGLQTDEYNNFNQALYALAFTVMVYAKERNRKYFDYDCIVSTELVLDGLPFEIPASKTSIEIQKDHLEWIKKRFNPDWLSFIEKLVGPTRFSSFHEARSHPFLSEYPTKDGDTRTLPSMVSIEKIEPPVTEAYTRGLYDRACKERIHSYLLAQIYDLFYAHNELHENKQELLAACSFPCNCDYENPLTVKILENDKGLYLSTILTENYEARLLLEYLIPGTWPLMVNSSLEEVFSLNKDWLNQPKRILQGRYGILNPNFIG